MKKIISILVITIILGSLMSSCKKQLDNSDGATMTNSSINHSRYNIEQRILAFKSNLESNLKTGREYPIDTAVWYEEALVNYTYASVANNQDWPYMDSISIEVA